MDRVRIYLKGETLSDDRNKVAVPALEESCPECSGLGYCWGSRCKCCNGTGVLPTDFGDQVLALVRHSLPEFGA